MEEVFFLLGKAQPFIYLLPSQEAGGIWSSPISTSAFSIYFTFNFLSAGSFTVFNVVINPSYPETTSLCWPHLSTLAFPPWLDFLTRLFIVIVCLPPPTIEFSVITFSYYSKKTVLAKVTNGIFLAKLRVCFVIFICVISAVFDVGCFSHLVALSCLALQCSVSLVLLLPLWFLCVCVCVWPFLPHLSPLFIP